MSKRRKKKIKKIIIIPIIILIIIIFAGILCLYKSKLDKEKHNQITKEDIISHYNEYVKVTKETDLYTLDNDSYIANGKIAKDTELTLKINTPTSSTKYFKIADFDDEYYIYYEDVEPIEKLKETSQRYKNYIVFNENIITDEETKFYDELDNLVYQINKSFNLPIIIKYEDKYGVEYNDRLLYIKKENVSEIKESDNTNEKNTAHVGVLNYHFFWDDDTESPSDCNQVICISKTNFKKHLDMINELNLLTIKMDELEMYIDGAIRLPKSVVITIDDGWKAKLGIDILNEYKMYGTLFLITGSYDPINYTTEYVELHSHTNKMHDGGKCPGGQGAAIKCLDRDTILNDLKTSREKLNNSKVLCYPFYEYNDYAITLVKEAGFTMAFAGENNQDNNYVKPGSKKYTLPRFVVVTYTTMNDLRTYLTN